MWLPLPHLLNALPVQVDAFYRTGASAVAISIVSFALATASLAWIVCAATGSRAAAVVGAAVFALNPNVLYLQSTPMTEPLLLGLTLARRGAACRVSPGGPSATPVIHRRRRPSRSRVSPATRPGPSPAPPWRSVCGPTGGKTGALLDAARRTVADAAWPVAAIAFFLLFSRIVVGEWFVSRFLRTRKPGTRPAAAAALTVLWGTGRLSSSLLIAAGGGGLVALAVRAFRDRAGAPALVGVALLASAALPWTAFLDGHPFRIRYMVPLLAAEAVGVGVAAGWLQRARRHAWVGLAIVIPLQLHPLSHEAPMVVEAQWDRPNVEGRGPVTEMLARNYDESTVMASMGSLGHYMHDLSREGFELRDFLHEGNGDIWLGALERPRPFVGWILIEELAEGGDMLAEHARANPRWLDGFTRVAEGAGLALYRRVQKDPAYRSRRPQRQHHQDVGGSFGPAALLEADLERGEVVEAAEIDLRPVEADVFVELARTVLVADLEARAEAAHRHVDAPQNQRPDRRAAVDEPIVEDAVVVEIHELARLAVAPREDAHAGADVRLDGRASAKGQESDGGAERHDAQLQILL